MANDLDLAWAAGFLDGEGCIGVYGRTDHKGSFSLRMSAAQVAEEPLLQLQAILGGKIRSVAPRNNQRRSFIWEIHQREAADALRRLIPYFRFKGEQARLAVEFLDRVPRRGDGAVPRVTAEEWAMRESLANQIRDLKWVAA